MQSDMGPLFATNVFSGQVDDIADNICCDKARFFLLVDLRTLLQ